MSRNCMLESSRHRDEIGHFEFLRRLRLDQFENVWDRHPMHGIVRGTAAGMKGRLEIDATNGRMANREADDLADLVFVHTTLNRRDYRDVETDLCKPVESTGLLFQNVGFAAEGPVRL